MNDQSVPYQNPSSLDNSAPISPELQQIQVDIGSSLEQAAKSSATERESLCKSLLISHVQLTALFEGDTQKFHSYGIYLRNLKAALDTLIPNQTAIHEQLKVLERHYFSTTRGSEIRRLQQTVNASLATAPDEESEGTRQLFGQKKWPVRFKGGFAFMAVTLTAIVIVLIVKTLV